MDEDEDSEEEELIIDETEIPPLEEITPEQEIRAQQVKERESKQGKEKQSGSRIGLKLFSAQTDNVPVKLRPSELFKAIQQKKVKFTYEAEDIKEEEIMKYLQDGTLSTEKFPIVPMELAVYKKIRSGMVRKKSGEKERKKR